MINKFILKTIKKISFSSFFLIELKHFLYHYIIKLHVIKTANQDVLKIFAFPSTFSQFCIRNCEPMQIADVWTCVFSIIKQFQTSDLNIIYSVLFLFHTKYTSESKPLIGNWALTNVLFPMSILFVEQTFWQYKTVLACLRALKSFAMQNTLLPSSFESFFWIMLKKLTCI